MACAAFGELVSLFVFFYNRIWALIISFGYNGRAVLLCQRDFRVLAFVCLCSTCGMHARKRDCLIEFWYNLGFILLPAGG